MEKIVGKEISEELLKQMNINTIEEYNNFVRDDNNKSDGKKGSKKLREKKNKVSQTKLKQEMRKKELVMNKKRKNDMRSQILESLEKHNREEAKLLETMDSMKNLGRKRKMSKEKKEEDLKENADGEEPELEEKEEEINNDIDDSESESEEEELTQNNKNKDKNVTMPNPLPLPLPLSNINTNQELRESILEEIKTFRSKEGLLLDFDEENETSDSSHKLLLPDKSNVILVNREESIQNERINLPIVKYEHEIMDKINNSLVSVVCGETGSGKSTQIPQFLYEYGYTKSLGGIVITQPRRVAAISLATRVSAELNTKLGEEVGYQVRYDSHHYSNNTVIKYVTDGILLKELESDKLLLKYSVIIIDEAHERTINTDIIIGLLSKLVKMRYLLAKNNVRIKNSGEEVKPLRLVIMSATMRVDEFMNSHIFKPNITPSFIKIEARQFPVTIHHAKRTLDDYNEQAFKLCCKVHHKLPPGGVLIFMTGKREIQDLCKRLTEEFESKLGYGEDSNNKEEVEQSNANLNEDTNVLEEEEEELKKISSYKPYIILPLYSSLPHEQQLKVFDKVPAEKRLIVIATNVAETSLTIPNIRYVIDTGRAKKRVFKSGLSFSEFKIEWISQASAEQRAGRAGRTGPGYCYRLFSNGLFAKLERYTEPQILSSPLDQMILYLKSLNISDISKFPFLTFPGRKFVEKTLRHLLVLGALKSDEDSEYNLIKHYINVNLSKDEEEEKIDYKDNTKISDIGKLMVKFPVPPKYGKIIILAKKLGLLEYALVIVAIMNVENIFESDNNRNKNEDAEQQDKDINSNNATLNVKNKSNIGLSNILDAKLLNPFSDIISQLNLILSLLKTDYDKNYIFTTFCKKYSLNSKKVKEMLDVLDQLLKISSIVFNSKFQTKEFKSINPPDSNSQTLLMQILLSGFIDNLARRRVIYDQAGNETDLTKNSVRRVIYECNENNEMCQIHPHSVIAKSNPDLIIYKEIIKENKTFLMCNTIVKPEWIYNLGGELVSFNLIKDSVINEPFYNKVEGTINCFVDIKYGYKNWDIPRVRVEMNKDDDNYLRYFARFLLEGKIFKEFSEFERFLNSKPSIITNQISILPKVTMLVNSLKYNKIKSSEDLLKFWKVRRTFLLDVFTNWIDDHKIKERIKIRWPLVKV